MPVRARLDFAVIADGRARWLRSPRTIIVADVVSDVPAVVARAESEAHAGRIVVGFVAYDAAPAFDPAMTVHGSGSEGRRLPLAWFASFDVAAHASDASESAQAHTATSFTPPELQPEISAAMHAAGVASVRAGIAAGDYYQVNLTQRLRGGIGDTGLHLYERLVAAGGGDYCVFIETDDWQVISASPELFFSVTGRAITCRPMKGTAPRGRWTAEDDALRARLAASPKDRAENVMIVDLVRNDLGRVAETGTVVVPSLFAIETYPTVHQMTSTITATLRPGARLLDVFRALFPCGSVTGAPKVAAMAAIAGLETSPRGVYCGTVGLIMPGGDCTFNVAIRTLVHHRGSQQSEYGVGGGITWDSEAGPEHDEMLVKARALTAPPRQALSLLETMRLSDGTVPELARHRRRLVGSARYFGFADPEEAFVAAALQCAAAHPTGTWRLRVVVSPAGEVTAAATPLDAPPDRPGVALASKIVHSGDVLLHHKTTCRATYDAAAAHHPDCWDVLLVNERGELTEFTRGNLVLDIAGRRLTPPLHSGLLGGVGREALLEHGVVSEQVLRVHDLARANGIWFINALRGQVPVSLTGLP